MDAAPYWHGVRKLMLAWAVIVLAGFSATYFLPSLAPNGINILWVALSVIGLAYSKTKMPFSDRGLKRIFLTWLVIIAAGIALSEAVFYVPPLAYLSAYLGALWLALMAAGHAACGILDKRKFYLLTVILQLAAAAFIVLFANAMPILYTVQYLIAGIAGSLSLVLLILFL